MAEFFKNLGSIDEPHWIVLIILGALVPIIFKGAELIFRGIYIFSATRDPIQGTWQSYHSTIKDREEVIHNRTFKISRSFKGGFSVLSNSDQTKNTKYKGLLRYEKGHILGKLQGKGHKETVHIRVLAPATPDTKILYGFWVGYHHGGKLCSGNIILSKSQLEEDEIKSEWTREVIENAFCRSLGETMQVSTEQRSEGKS